MCPTGDPIPHLQSLPADLALPALDCGTATRRAPLAASEAPLDLSTGEDPSFTCWRCGRWRSEQAVWGRPSMLDGEHRHSRRECPGASLDSKFSRPSLVATKL